MTPQIQKTLDKKVKAIKKDRIQVQSPKPTLKDQQTVVKRRVNLNRICTDNVSYKIHHLWVLATPRFV